LDISGNVYEWCWDWFDNYPGTNQIDPIGAATGSSRISRGGSWCTNAPGCTVADRYYFTPATTSSIIGFRLVRPDPNAATVPTNLIATPGAGEVSLSWTASTNANSYNVYYQAGSTATTASAKASAAMISGTAATITGLTGGTQYAFVVTALNGMNESPASLVATATPSAASGIPRNGLVAEYLFNGDASDTAGTNNGTVNGATLATDRFGTAGHAYSFNGSSSSISTSVLPASFSVVTWIKATDMSIYNIWDTLIATSDGICVHFGTGTGKPFIGSGSGTGGIGTSLSSTIAIDGAWKMITAIYSGSSAKLYIGFPENIIY
jgi:hypothetical protein